jgi:hypothetical protein
MLLGVGTYTFTLIASTSQGGSVASKAVTVQATCDRRWFEPILTAGLAGCKKPPQVQWQQ